MCGHTAGFFQGCLCASSSRPFRFVRALTGWMAQQLAGQSGVLKLQARLHSGCQELVEGLRSCWAFPQVQLAPMAHSSCTAPQHPDHAVLALMARSCCSAHQRPEHASPAGAGQAREWLTKALRQVGSSGTSCGREHGA